MYTGPSGPTPTSTFAVGTKMALYISPASLQYLKEGAGAPGVLVKSEATLCDFDTIYDKLWQNSNQAAKCGPTLSDHNIP